MKATIFIALLINALNFLWRDVNLHIVKHRALLPGSISIKARTLETPSKRAHHALIYDEKNKCILMTAGSTPLDGGKSSDVFNDLWQFEGRQWQKIGWAGDKRSGIQLAFDTKRNKIFSFGGFSGNNSLADLRVLEGNEWKPITDTDEMKSTEPGFVYDSARDRLVFFGGSPGRDLVNSATWEWDGHAWTKFQGSGPGGRTAFAMVYDSKRKKTVVFGGRGNSFNQRFSDTWEYDGSSWTRMSETGPPARSGPGFAYDSKREMMIIFGGGGTGGVLNDTWGWDGKEWKKLADAGPPARTMGYMAYDKKRDRIVLFGGRMGWPNDANDTWEWDGKQWSEVKSD